jgi:hypothetical protein
MDPGIVTQRIEQTTGITPGGQLVNIFVVHYTVDEQGPFRAEFKIADFNATNVRAEQERMAATVRAIR